MNGADYRQQQECEERQQQEEERNNLNLWDKVKRPPVTALKTIQAGRLKGMSDINPQWRLQVMTEQFGQIGIGWYFEIKERWTEAGPAGEVMAFIQVNLFTRKGANWSAPIVGIGGSALIAKESAGLRASDEAYKMATTDALSVAMKQLGIAADIYMGLWDGSKYKEDPAQRLPKLTDEQAHENWIATKLDLIDPETGEAENEAITEAWGLLPRNVRSAIKRYGESLKTVSEIDQQAKDHLKDI